MVAVAAEEVVLGAVVAEEVALGTEVVEVASGIEVAEVDSVGAEEEVVVSGCPQLGPKI